MREYQDDNIGFQAFPLIAGVLAAISLVGLQLGNQFELSSKFRIVMRGLNFPSSPPMMVVDQDNPKMLFTI
jgi:hypothetical protein